MAATSTSPGERGKGAGQDWCLKGLMGARSQEASCVLNGEAMLDWLITMKCINVCWKINMCDGETRCDLLMSLRV